MKERGIIIVLGLLIMCTLSACQVSRATTPSETDDLVEISMMLDWVPNTNHTGIFVAADQGYFTEAGLEVKIIEPGEVYAEQAVSSGTVDFGISFQEQVTIARANEVPLVSIAAIIQHNTSGFASRGPLQVSSPRDWEGLRYGAFGSPFEEPTLQALMQCDGADFDQLEIVDTGFADPLALLSEEQTDLAWIFYAWQGIQAEQQALNLNLLMMENWFDCIPDYYTPIIITSESMVDEQPQIIRAFLQAITRGYEFTIRDPEAAAQILLQAVPELDSELVSASQEWISPRYQADANRWGEQSAEVWEAYATWMLDNRIIEDMIDPDASMTNAFLP